MLAEIPTLVWVIVIGVFVLSLTSFCAIGVIAWRTWRSAKAEHDECGERIRSRGVRITPVKRGDSDAG